ncbi:amidohydrolase family protein [Parasphingorhabdus sp.]|uniref:amidohydrolase family protein n=1 Tax=Parasphingorhabdus sp. TaxID=2709688 RepID=UPI003A8D678E
MLITNVRILALSETQPTFTAGMSVLVSDGIIEQVAPDIPSSASAGAVVIDGAGRIVMPGLVDMHVHIWDEAALGAYLANGVTTVRNASGMPLHLDLSERIRTGELAGPRVITTGPILNSPGPNAQVIHQIIMTDDEARAAVRAQQQAGFRRLKVYSNLTREAYEAVLDEARSLGMTIMGHSPEGVRATGMPHDIPFEIAFEDLIDDGFVTFEHIESIVWHGLRDRHDPRAARVLGEKIAEAGVAVDPTLLAFYNLLRVAETRGEYLSRPGVEILNPLVVQQEKANYERWASEDIERNRKAFEFYKQATRIFAEAGVLLVTGSDAGIFTNIPGRSLIKELELLHEAGLSRLHVLRAATVNTAIALGEQGRFGAIAEGQRADFLLLENDPTEDLTALKTPSAVVADGRYYGREDLQRLNAAASQHHPERTQRNLVEGLQAQGADVSVLGL